MPKRPLLERLRQKKAMQRGPVAVGWYTPDEWDRVKAVAADPEVLENSFQEWEAMATDALRDLRCWRRSSQGFDLGRRTSSMVSCPRKARAG